MHYSSRTFFLQVVTAGHDDSQVYVWNVATAAKEMQFVAFNAFINGKKKRVEVTSMCFDASFRKLLTASEFPLKN